MDNEKTTLDSETLKKGSEERIYSPEEIQEFRSKMKAFYEEELPYLRLQEEYERLVANIEVHKFNKLNAAVQASYLYQQMSSPDEDNTKEKSSDVPEDTSKLKEPRKLKKI